MCDLCNTDAESETEISAVPQTVHVCSIFISCCKFRIFTYIQFQNIKATTCYFIQGYYNLCICVYIHACTCSLFPPPTPCVILFKLYNMPFLFLPFKKTLKLLLINTFARTVPWVNRPLNFGKNKNKTYCSEKSKIKNIFPISP